MESNVHAAEEGSPPLPDVRAVTRVGVVGLALAAVAGVFGLGLDWSADSPALWTVAVRNVLAAVGVLVAGCAVSMRPTLIQAWLLAAGACGLAYPGFAPEWDSARMVAAAFGGVALGGALMLALPPAWRYGLAAIPIVWHYSGIFSAVTSPPPQPFLSSQLWTRVFHNYLHFTYMNNAYQFYSPDPGPASEVWVCFEFRPRGSEEAFAPDQAADQRTTRRWLKIPRRPQDFKDPLGQAYYRRLALTEQLVSPGATYSIPAREQEEVFRLRQTRKDIPFHPELASNVQYRPPTEQVRRLLLPAYAAHLGRVYKDALPGLELKTMKIYRSLHQLISAAQFAGNPQMRLSPYDPTTYIPVFQGEYDREGNLVNPQDPLLFWAIPIVRKDGVPGTTNRMYAFSDEEYRKHFIDYVTVHARSDHRSEKEQMP